MPAAALGGLAAACSPLGTIDALTAYDAGAAKVADGVAYGPAARQRLDVYAPVETGAPATAETGAGDRRHPVVVFVYGGSWAGGDRRHYGFLGHALAARGFVTVVPDYRLVPEVTYPAFVEDAAAAVRWARAHAGRYGGDPGRLAVAGHSAGAYNAVMLATDPQYTDPDSPDHLPLDAAVGLAGPYDFLPLDVDVTRRAFAGTPDLPATQPVNIVTGQGPALLLAHGADDTTVRPANSRALAQAARAHGRAVTLTIYPETGHAEILLAFSRLFRGEPPVLADVTAFLRRELTPRAVPTR
ncbi:alpha/beta hydrolase [Rhodovibrio sodomensis]|uniref:alpha/beta hydrolase n=1 Tax=Rhodovibrio sodomensis TaxID=1088 RepID=UPI0019054561|nr:alpha/beta hydrolase [Rhodovibrio sodomensis]